MKPIRTIMVRNCRGITGMTGGETYLLQLLKGFDPEQCQCLLVCIVRPSLGETPWLVELKKTGFDYVEIPIENALNFSDVKKIAELTKTFGADIIHALDHRSNLVALLAAKISGLPVVASFLGWVNFPKGSWRAKVYPWIDRMILKRLDAVITDSVAIGVELQMGDDDPPVVAIRNGIDTEWFDPNKTLPPFSQQAFTREAAFVFGMVGRIHPVKGHFNFLQAAIEILAKHPDCRFLIVGTVLPGFDYYRQELDDFIDSHQLRQSVLMTHVSLEEIPAVFASLNVLVAPSYAESFSFTLLEGMAMEKAVISSDVGGACEMITDGKNGYLIAVDDVVALTEKMSRLIQEPDTVRRVGQSARQKIIEDLGIAVMAKKTCQVYQQLIGYKQQGTNAKQARAALKEQLAQVTAR